MKIGEGINVGVPAYDEPAFFGKECKDKVTGFQGVCIGRVVSLFNATQYIVEYQPEDMSKESRVVWLDEGRLEVVGMKVELEKVQSSRPGCSSAVMPRTMMPGVI